MMLWYEEGGRDVGCQQRLLEERCWRLTLWLEWFVKAGKKHKAYMAFEGSDRRLSLVVGGPSAFTWRIWYDDETFVGGL